MSKNGDFDWPVFTVPDLVLWSYLKSKDYANKPRTLDALKANIRQEMAISTEIFSKTIKTLPNDIILKK